MLPATDSTAFLIGQTIGFLFVFFLLVIFPMLAILRMARMSESAGPTGSSGSSSSIVCPCSVPSPISYGS